MAAFGSRLSSSGTLKQVLRSASVAFLDADANNDGVLSFDEFKDMLSSTVAEQGTDEEIRDIFDAADENKNGAISREEYFLWTLTLLQYSGATSGLQELFKTKQERMNQKWIDCSDHR